MTTLVVMGDGDFGLQFRRIRLSARIAIARSGLPVSPELLEVTQADLATTETTLTHMRRDPSRRDAQLALAMGLSGDQLDFLWGVVARAFDPLLLALLQPICGTEVRR